MKWALTLICAFAVQLPLSAQGGDDKNVGGNQNPQQLATTAESYEKFLHEPGAGSPQARIEVQEHLGAVYFLLHRYQDSLDVLTPVLREESTSPSANKSRTSSLRAQSWLVCGLDHLELNQLQKAAHALRRSLSLEPGSANARMALGDALARSGQMEQAVKEYEKQASLTPNLADAWYKLGLAHSQIAAELPRAHNAKPADQGLVQQLIAEEMLSKGDNLNAARTLFRVARQSPNQPNVQADLGTALLALGYVKAAQDHFEEELPKNPESPLAELGLVQTSAFGGDWTQVRTRLEHLSQTKPRASIRLFETPPAGLVVQAWAAGQIKPPDSFLTSAAGTIWKSWLSDSNVIAQLSDQRDDGTAACAEQMKDPSPGVWLTEKCYSTLAAKLRAKASKSLGERAKLAEADFRLGQYDAALRAAQALRAVDPHSGWALYWLSKTHDAIAEECFLKVGALNPDSARVHQMLAEHYTKLSDYPRAKAEFQSALRLAPDSPDLHLGLGTVLSRSGDLEQAERELKTTLELAPQSAFAHYELGHLYVRQSQWQPAADQLRQVPNDSTVLLSARLDLAKAESAIGKTSDAVNDLLSVAPLDQDGELYFRLAALYRTLGDSVRSRDAMTTFKQRRAASLQTDTEEVGALEKEQEINRTGKPQSP